MCRAGSASVEPEATKCAVPADRDRVMDMISDLYRAAAVG